MEKGNTEAYTTNGHFYDIMLTDIKIRKTNPSDKIIRLVDGHGLYMEVRPCGSKLWRYRYKINGKAGLFALGEYPKISLQDARKAREEARELVKKGIHPAHARRKEKADQMHSSAITFELIAREWLEIKSKKCTEEYVAQVTSCLENNAYPNLGKLPIRDISSGMVLAILKEMESRGAHSFALLLKQWMSAIFKYAIVTLRAEADPTYVLQGAIERPAVKNSKPMSKDDIAEFKRRLDKYRGHYTSIYALRLMLYTFVRTTEIRHAEWSEIDFKNKEWRIPPERMKMSRLHIVPLSKQVISLLEDLKRISRGKYLFPNISKPKAVMSENTINMALYYMGYKKYEWTGHDFRATASTHLHEMKFPDEWIELQLAHIDKNKTRGAYNHARHLSERANMMQSWADWIDGV